MTELPAPAQTRNLLIFAACTALQYFAAPVNYVGSLHAELCQTFKMSASVSNLPESLFFAMTISPLLLATFVKGARWLKPCLSGCYLMSAAANALVAVVLNLPVDPLVKVGSVILQGALTGIAMTTAIALLWETVGRGVSEKRRGLALALAFGFGPLLGIPGSLLAQGLVTGKVLNWSVWSPPFPSSYAVVFGVACPAMFLAGALCWGLTVPDVDSDEEPAPALEPDSQNQGSQALVERRHGNLEFLCDPVLRMALFVTLLLYVGNTITANMALHAKFVLPADYEASSGYQLANRFAFKFAAGLSLGWLLAKSNPRAGILATGLIFIASQVWASAVTGKMYLLAFGIYGAGELVGVYAPNYILSASSGKNLRLNMGIASMLMMVTAPLPWLFGRLVDVLNFYAGLTKPQAYRATFLLCAACMAAGLVLTVVRLPRWPRRKPADGEQSPAENRP